jgi:hypothetical protein
MGIEISPTVAEVRDEIQTKFERALETRVLDMPLKGSDDYQVLALLANALVAVVNRPLTVKGMERLFDIIGQEMATHRLTASNHFRKDDCVKAICQWIIWRLALCGGEE